MKKTAVIIMMCLALSSCAGKQNDESNTLLTEDKVNSESVTENVNDSESEELQLIVENGMFGFTAEQFGERFADTLPDGFAFADKVEISASQDEKIQLNILDETGTFTDVSILMDAKAQDLPLKKMALVIKEDWYEEDVSELLDWYIDTFFEGFKEQEKLEIYENYFDMFTNRDDEYIFFSSDSCEVMMIRNTENDANYYYVMISICE